MTVGPVSPPQAPEPVERRGVAPGSGLSFRVYGVPAPQGSKRHVGGGRMIESSKRVKPWREAVKSAAREAIDALPTADHYWRLVPMAFEITVTFIFPRPRHHFRTGRNAHPLRDNAPTRPAKKPDIDKLLRSTFDAIGDAGGIWLDDAQVVTVTAHKVYESPSYGTAGAIVTVEAVTR